MRFNWTLPSAPSSLFPISPSSDFHYRHYLWVQAATSPFSAQGRVPSWYAHNTRLSKCRCHVNASFLSSTMSTRSGSSSMNREQGRPPALPYPTSHSSHRSNSQPPSVTASRTPPPRPPTPYPLRASGGTQHTRLPPSPPPSDTSSTQSSLQRAQSLRVRHRHTRTDSHSNGGSWRSGYIPPVSSPPPARSTSTPPVSNGRPPRNIVRVARRTVEMYTLVPGWSIVPVPLDRADSMTTMDLVLENSAVAVVDRGATRSRRLRHTGTRSIGGSAHSKAESLADADADRVSTSPDSGGRPHCVPRRLFPRSESNIGTGEGVADSQGRAKPRSSTHAALPREFLKPRSNHAGHSSSRTLSIRSGTGTTTTEPRPSSSSTSQKTHSSQRSGTRSQSGSFDFVEY
ncbi:hypothetical protein FB45DRAFT_952666 [Roridomyces roridus]|uniref:Uncharacterized protein n=1 Tax=Roridomyces roridus TaxID=1738132 RepID=A0AAD7F8N4_9AGAR|nr:hypothetical protein FB45DRAFT_952666 [Roridomyces roridus]